MKILVLSDSHSALSFMRRCVEAICPDAVVHLGDHYDDAEALKEEFPGIPFYQVPGNCDRYRYATGTPEIRIERICGLDIYFTHGHRHGVKQVLSLLLKDARACKVKAVLYGRNIFKSIRKFISLQLMMNFCAVGVSMICPFLGFDAPVTVVQMLWINVIMDTLGGLAFAGEAPLPSCMTEMPKRRDETILNPYMIYEIVFGGGFTVALCIAFLKMPEISGHFRGSPDRIYLLTAFFALFIFASVFNCFCARTDRISLLSGITKNRAFIGIMASILFIQILFVYLGGSVLRTAPLLPRELFLTFAIAILVFPADLLRKLIWRVLGGKDGY